MNDLPLMHKVAIGAIAAYGLISLIGGLMGFRAGSTASLVAGGIAGVLLLIAAVGVLYSPFWSLLGALVIALGLLGRFAPRALQGLGNFGDFISTTVGKTALIMTLGGLAVAILAGLALATRAGPPTPPAGP